MDDSTKTLFKVAAGVAVAYLVYDYLQSSGLWAQWFGGAASTPALPANSFTSQSQLLAYCAMNPLSQATFVDSSGNATTLSCVTWLMNDGRIPTAAAAKQSTGTQPTGPIDPRISALQQLAGGDSASVDQWNVFYQQVAPGSSPLPAASSGDIDASTYISLRNATGLGSVPVVVDVPAYADAYDGGFVN